MKITTKLNSTSADTQAPALSGPARPRESLALATPQYTALGGPNEICGVKTTFQNAAKRAKDHLAKPLHCAIDRPMAPDDEVVAVREAHNPSTATELAALQTQAMQSLQAYVFATLRYVAALGAEAGSPTSVTIKIGHFRREGLAVNERLADFFDSARHILSDLADVPQHRLPEFSHVHAVANSPVSSQDILASVHKLSPREFDVAELLVKGLPNKQISYELGISPTTVKAHIGSILRKLNVSNRCRVIALLANIDLAAKAKLSVAHD
jgi:DNA-binding NarL/FixJ family response regulator